MPSLITTALFLRLNRSAHEERTMTIPYELDGVIRFKNLAKKSVPL